MKIYEIIKTPVGLTNHDNEKVIHLDMYADLNNAMHWVECRLVNIPRIMWQIDEWGNFEAHSATKDEHTRDAELWTIRYMGYMIKPHEVIN